MARLKHGVFGPVSGKLGSVVGGSWKGIPYLRSVPKKKKKPAPPSAAQIGNEQKMKFTNKALVPFQAYINIGFQHYAIEKTALSAAYSRMGGQELVVYVSMTSMDRKRISDSVYLGRMIP